MKISSLIKSHFLYFILYFKIYDRQIVIYIQVIHHKYSQYKRTMLQQEKEDDLQLQELIEIVNAKPRQLKPIHPNNRETLPPTIQKATSERQTVSKLLRFKPWSGNDIIQGQNYIIREEIEGIEQENQEQSCNENEKGIDNFSEVSNMAKHDQIGYFYKFQNGPVKLIKKLLDQNGFKYANTNKNWTIYWSSTVIKNQTYEALLPYQKINHFPNSFHITRKDLMNKCISKMQIRHGYSHFNFLPKTFILPQEMDLLKEQMNKTPGLTYIVKPHNRSQGKGIAVTNQLSLIYSKLEKYSSLIVSHYVDNPLLINNLKFDLRIYVALTGVNPLRFYIYEQGLGRFATEAYDQSGQDCQNKKFQHLTNYSVNKKNTQFVKSQKQNEQYFGSKWSLTALKDFLNFSVGKDQTKELFDRIDDLIVKTILSAENILYTAFMGHVPYNNSCFQVLGFDVLIDSNLKPWLMEVNMSPSMNSDSPLDIKIKGNMIADLLTMVGITPLSQRYLDGNHLRFDMKNYHKPDNKQAQLGPVQKFILKQVQIENNRRGAWRRLFPTNDKRYKQFFEVDRYFNKVIRQFDLPPLQSQYRSNMSDKQRNSFSKKQPIIKMNTQAQQNYFSVNDRKKPDLRQKGAFAIRTQTKSGYNKRVYL